MNEVHSAQSIVVVCVANYCRSPVAEYFLKQHLGSKFNVYSAGINPLYRVGMDPRSEKFLIQNGIKPKEHIPKKISLSLVKNAKYILALDLYILNELNNLFPKYKEKIKLLNFQSPSKNLIDPFKLDDTSYKSIMNNIKNVCFSFIF